MDEDAFNNWHTNSYKKALADLNNRDELVQAAINNLEQDMELLGVTGVEDKL